MDLSTLEEQNPLSVNEFYNKYHCALECEKLSNCYMWCKMTDNKCWLTDLWVSDSYIQAIGPLVTCYIEERGNEIPDVAVGKTGYQMSTYQGRGVSNILDGYYSATTGLLKISCTSMKNNPWVNIDLGAPADVYEVRIYNFGGFVKWCKNIEIKVGTTLKTNGDFSSYTLFYYWDGPCKKYEATKFTAAPVTGRYVSIQVLSKKIHLCIEHLEISALFV